jgi:fluoride ion exporter CrcB/FEX
MQLELYTMIDGGSYGLAVAYATTSVLAGFAAVAAGSAAVRRARLTR